jgi:DNA-binding MarR family transcriptional regulator
MSPEDSAGGFAPIVPPVLDEDRAAELMDEVAELYAIVLRTSRQVRDGDYAMTATQRLALIEIAAAGPLRPNLLARRMDTTPATVTRAIDVLVEAGFVRRTDHRDDRRGILIEVTKKGARWAEKRRKLVREAITQIPPDVAPARLVRDLNRLNAALREATGVDEISRGALLAP